MDVIKQYHFHDGEFTSLEHTDNSLLLKLNQVYEKKRREYINNSTLYISGISSLEAHFLYDIKLKKNKKQKLKNIDDLIEHIKTYGYILSFDKKGNKYVMLIDVFKEYFLELHFSATNIELKV